MEILKSLGRFPPAGGLAFALLMPWRDLQKNAKGFSLQSLTQIDVAPTVIRWYYA